MARPSCTGEDLDPPCRGVFIQEGALEAALAAVKSQVAVSQVMAIPLSRDDDGD